MTLNISISQNPARDPSVPCGKLRVGPGEPEKVDIAEQVIRDRVQEVSEMRDASKGKGKVGNFFFGEFVFVAISSCDLDNFFPLRIQHTIASLHSPPSVNE